MSPLDEYVKSEEEVDIVSAVREGYVETHVDFLVENAGIDTDSVIVDVPCGTGDMAAAICERVRPSEIVLFDINKHMVEAAKKKVPVECRGVVADAGDVGALLEAPVDAILCLNGFHQYIERKEDFVRGCASVLCPGGVLVFDVSTRGLYDERTAAFFRRQAEELARLAREHGTTSSLPGWADAERLGGYEELLLREGFVVGREEFSSYLTVQDVLSEATVVPGRSRPWLPGMEYEQRKALLERSIKASAEELGENPVEKNRVFFVAEKRGV